MKQFTFLLFFIVFFTTINAQIEFEPGYFVDEQGNTIECLIKNKAWKDNPESFEYRLNSDSGVQTITISDAQVVAIGREAKFIRKNIRIDTSSNLVNELSEERQPLWREETRFLQVLVEGEANLYVYEGRNIERYFYDIDDGETEQLIYKKYLNAENRIATNYGYIGQLKIQVACESMPLKYEPDYNAKSLTKYFVDYNECNDVNPVTYVTSGSKGMIFQLRARPGISFSSLYVDNEVSDSRDADFGSKTTFRIGLEMGVVLPFNQNKWEITLEPTYRYFKATGENPFRTVEIDYTSIELPIGIRYYFFLNETSRLFINGAFIFDFTLNAKMSYSNNFDDLEVATPENFAFGAGYAFGKFSLEGRYFTNRTVLHNRLFWDAELRNFSFVLGYQLF